MKKIFILAMAAAAMVSCGTATKYTITGTSEEFVDGKWAFVGEKGRTDSVQIVGNSFTLKGEVETPYAAYVTIGEPNTRPEIVVRMFVEPGKIEIKKLNPEHRSFSAVGTTMNDKQSDFNNKVWELQKNDGSDEEYIALHKSFIEENIDNVLGLNAFKGSYYYFKPQDVIALIDAMPAAAQEELAKTKESAEKALKVLPGNPYIDVVEKDANGKEISLKSVVENKNNKYVLLDFWASWCGPCMGEMPYLRDAYAKYHKKGFEIFGVSFDSKAEAWKGAIAKQNMKWVNVSLLQSFQNEAAEAYVVESIPTNFLIDCATGEIIAKNLRGEAVEAKLKELL